VALLHHPVLLKDQTSGTTSLTNLDIHDISRISRTYGLGGVFAVTPLEDQRRLLHTLLAHWISGSGASSNPDRAEALRLIQPAESLDAVLAALNRLYGTAPLVVGASARHEPDKKGRESRPALPFGQMRQQLGHRPALLLLGTGHGLAPEALARCDAILPPLRWMDGYNHLPVRAAAAVLLDRLLGDRG
jgi:tRNA (guanine37-N1)-methyltransferase